MLLKGLLPHVFSMFSRTDQSRRDSVIKVREDQTSVLEECLLDTGLGRGAIPTTDPQLQVETEGSTYQLRTARKQSRGWTVHSACL